MLFRSERLAQTPQDAAVRSSLAAYLAKSGDTDRALAELAPVGQTLESEKGVLFKAALVYELAGKREQALDVLERAILAGYSMHEVANEPELGALRSDPRYAKIAFRAAASRKR